MRRIMHHAEEVLAVRHNDNLMFPRAHAEQLDLVLFLAITLYILIFLGCGRARTVRVAPVLRI
jgi:hypothetical protein